jgi:hypothetical protein
MGGCMRAISAPASVASTQAGVKSSVPIHIQGKQPERRHEFLLAQAVGRFVGGRSPFLPGAPGEMSRCSSFMLAVRPENRDWM